jgi:hypothetical protein
MSVAAAPFARLTEAGVNEQADPAGKFPIQASMTVLLKLLNGVTFSAAVPACPAVIKITGDPEMLKSGIVTWKAIDGELDSEKFWSPE